MIITQTVTNHSLIMQVYYDYLGRAHTLAPGETSTIQVDDHVPVPASGGGAQKLDDLTDVEVPTPAEANVLTWNAILARWENRAPYSAPVTAVVIPRRKLVVMPSPSQPGSMYYYGCLAPSIHGTGSKTSSPDADFLWELWSDFTPAGALYMAQEHVRASFNFSFFCRVKTQASVSNWRFMLGMRTSGANDADYPDSDALCFVSHDGGHFFSCSRAGAGHNEVDSNITILPNTVYEFEIVATATTVVYKINGAVVATVSADIPFIGLWPCIWIMVDEPKSLKFNLMSVEW